MKQQPLFLDLDQVKAQRHSPTSVEAAQSMEGKTDSARRKVLEAIQSERESGMTDEEITHSTWLPANTARPRRIELVEMGLVVDSGRTRLTHSKRKAVVWVATQFIGS